MNSQKWLDLSEYSTKFQVSISTLRRRIKANQVEFRLENGKYLLKDQMLGKVKAKRQTGAKAPPQDRSGSGLNQKKSRAPHSSGRPQDELSSQSILAEIKKAYSINLQEKEEVIVELKSEISDLNTLVRVLEVENEKLMAKLNSKDSAAVKTGSKAKESEQTDSGQPLPLLDKDWVLDL